MEAIDLEALLHRFMNKVSVSISEMWAFTFRIEKKKENSQQFINTFVLIPKLFYLRSKMYFQLYSLAWK